MRSTIGPEGFWWAMGSNADPAFGSAALSEGRSLKTVDLQKTDLPLSFGPGGARQLPGEPLRCGRGWGSLSSVGYTYGYSRPAPAGAATTTSPCSRCCFYHLKFSSHCPLISFHRSRNDLGARAGRSRPSVQRATGATGNRRIHCWISPSRRLVRSRCAKRARRAASV